MKKEIEKKKRRSLGLLIVLEKTKFLYIFITECGQVPLVNYTAIVTNYNNYLENNLRLWL